MKKLVLIAGGGLVLFALAVAALVAVTLIRDDDPNLATEAPAIPTPSATASVSPAAATPATGTPSAGATSSTSVLKFVVDPTESSATYVVREKLSRLPVETDASGTTQDSSTGPDVTGELYLTPQGLATANKSTFRVDLNTIRSDESLRDSFVRDNTLQTRTGNNRYADFTIDSVTGFPTNYVEGQEVSLSLTGQMTIHGVTKPVTFQVKARRAGEFLTATADTQFNMTDFGITPPNVPSARAQDLVKLQVILVTKLAAG